MSSPHAADQRDQASWQARYRRYLTWTAATCRKEEARAGRVVRRGHQSTQPAWSRRRGKVADKASDALLSATFYRLLAEHLEAGDRVDRTVGHAFTMKQLADLEAKARELAPNSIDTYLRRTPADARA